MMFRLLVLAAVLVSAYSKKELVFTNCPGGVIKVTHVEDLDNPTSGPITRHLRAKGEFTVTKELSAEKDLYETDISITLKLWAIFGYIPAPGFIYDMLGKALESKGELTYIGNGVFRAHCLWKHLFGQCQPPVGEHVKTLDLEYLMTKALSPVAGLMPARGWYKAHVEGKTINKEEAFCFNLTFELIPK